MIIKIDSPSEYELKDMLWSGAEKALEEIIDADKFEALENYIDKIYEGEIGLTELNDILRFDFDQLKKDIGMFDLEDEVDVKALEKFRDELEDWKKPRMITDSDMIGYGEESEGDLSDNIDEIISRIDNTLDSIDSVLDSDDINELEDAKDELESDYETLTDGVEEYIEEGSKPYKALMDFNIGDFFYNI